MSFREENKRFITMLTVWFRMFSLVLVVLGIAVVFKVVFKPTGFLESLTAFIAAACVITIQLTFIVEFYLYVVRDDLKAMCSDIASVYRRLFKRKEKPQP